MIIVRLVGGMGNQMFQYAFGRYLSLKHNTTLKLDLSFLLDRTPRKDFVYRDYDLGIFNIEENFASEHEVASMKYWSSFPAWNRVMTAVMGAKKGHVLEPHPQFSEVAYNSPDNVFLEGYWQTEKYFQAIEDIIKKDFVVKDDLAAPSRLLAHEIRNSNSVCVNVRRGDFVQKSIHNVCDLRYFSEAAQVISSQVENPCFYVFSDEIDWCREHLRCFSAATFVSHEYAGPKFQDYLRLMSLCRHFIIPNSTFAWWASYLSCSRDNVVIAPKKWMADKDYNDVDVFRTHWIRI